jgi:CelD/BcsL family acetyltransferase involved in cellulose biosynthesis
VEGSVVHPSTLTADEVACWRRLQLGAFANPFLGPEFAIAVGRARPDARVTVLRELGRMVGFFAYQVKPLGIAGPLGAGLSDCQAIVHDRSWPLDPVELLAAAGLRAWDFDHLLADQCSFRPFHTAVRESPVIDLRLGFARYCEDRGRHSKSLLSSVRRKAKKLGREVGEVRLVYEQAPLADLARVRDWKRAQYWRSGHRDQWARRWVHDLVRELAVWRTPEFAGSLSMLYAGDTPIAGLFGLRSSTVLASWFPAYDEAHARYSPGMILFLKLAEAAAANGLHSIDLGKGPELYKLRLANASVPVAEGWVDRSPLGNVVCGGRRAMRRTLFCGPWGPQARALVTAGRRVRALRAT